MTQTFISRTATCSPCTPASSALPPRFPCRVRTARSSGILHRSSAAFRLHLRRIVAGRRPFLTAAAWRQTLPFHETEQPWPAISSAFPAETMVVRLLKDADYFFRAARVMRPMCRVQEVGKKPGNLSDLRSRLNTADFSRLSGVGCSTEALSNLLHPDGSPRRHGGHGEDGRWEREKG
jgi:hypothetical protein